MPYIGSVIGNSDCPMPMQLHACFSNIHTAGTTKASTGNAANSEKAYLEATRIAQIKLDSPHPIRLGLALNFAVYYYEIANKPVKACQSAKKVNTECKSHNNLSSIFKSFRSHLAGPCVLIQVPSDDASNALGHASSLCIST